MLGIDIKLLDSRATVPTQGKASDAGYDLYAIDSYVVYPGQRQLVPTGIAVAIPEGYVGYVKPRSGLAVKYGIDVLAGVIDSGYRGDVGVVLQNVDPNRAFNIVPGDRIAQLVIQPVMDVEWCEVAELAESDRAAAGFGSTGVR